MALQWPAVNIDIVTDCRTVLQWVTDALSGKASLRSKAASEILIRRRLCTLKSLVDEYSLNISVSCVPSASNKSDTLTRVPVVAACAGRGRCGRERTRGARRCRCSQGHGCACQCWLWRGSGSLACVAGAADECAASTAGRVTDCSAEPCDAAEADSSADDDRDTTRGQVRDIRVHHTAGHPGIRRTFFFARRVLPGVTKGLVREDCDIRL